MSENNNIIRNNKLIERGIRTATMKGYLTVDGPMLYPTTETQIKRNMEDLVKYEHWIIDEMEKKGKYYEEIYVWDNRLFVGEHQIVRPYYRTADVFKGKSPFEIWGENEFSRITKMGGEDIPRWSELIWNKADERLLRNYQVPSVAKNILMRMQVKELIPININCYYMDKDGEIWSKGDHRMLREGRPTEFVRAVKIDGEWAVMWYDNNTLDRIAKLYTYDDKKKDIREREIYLDDTVEVHTITIYDSNYLTFGDVRKNVEILSKGEMVTIWNVDPKEIRMRLEKEGDIYTLKMEEVKKEVSKPVKNNEASVKGSNQNMIG